MFTRVWPGKPYPLGATWDGSGVNFALYSENATMVELCLFGGRAPGLNWELVLDTSNLALTGRRLEHLGDYLLQGRTLAVLRPDLPPSAQMKSNP